MWQELAADTTLVPSPRLPASATGAPRARPRAGRWAPLPSWGSCGEDLLSRGFLRPWQSPVLPATPRRSWELQVMAPGPEDQVAPCSPLPTPVTSCLGVPSAEGAEEWGFEMRNSRSVVA